MINLPTFLVLRFYGRFVFVRSKDKLVALALNMQIKHVDTAPHNAFLTVRERNVRHEKARRPDYRIMPNNVVPYDGCRLLYNLNQCDLTVPGTGELKWTPSIKLADLETLLRWSSVRPTFKKKLLDGLMPDSPVCAIIRINAGFCTAFHEFDEKLQLMKYRYVSKHNPAGFGDGEFLADMVQVVTFTTDQNPTLSIVGQGAIPIRATPLLPTDMLADVTKTTTWKQFVPKGAVLTFTNLCTTSPQGPTDGEFAAYYEIFDNAPPIEERFVPEAVDWDADSIMELRPSGDCFLSAQLPLDE